MTWKNALDRAVKKEMQPMRQATYWVIFVSCAIITASLTISSASAASMALIEMNPEIVTSSWLAK